MRATWTRTNDPYWYREGGSTSWGLGFEVVHDAELIDMRDGYDVEGSGVQINMTLGPWLLTIYSESAFHNMYGSDVAYMGRFEVMP